MKSGELYITRFSAWALGIEGAAEWNEWARGGRQMRSGQEAPELAFTDSMFRRRLSQISKMTIQVVHDLLPLGEDTKMIFLSFRGEISRQYRINKMQIEEGSLMPAAFSLSVFNASPALASMALGLKGGYSALYPGGNSFGAGLAAAAAALLAKTAEELVVVYADEEAPPEYARLMSGRPPPFAFGFLLGKQPGAEGGLCGLAVEDGAISLFSSGKYTSLNKGESCPVDFLRFLFLSRGIYVSP